MAVPCHTGVGLDLSMGGPLAGAAGLGGLWEEGGIDAPVGIQEIPMEEEGSEHWKGQRDSEEGVIGIELRMCGVLVK